NNHKALTCFFNDTGKALVELGIKLVYVHKKETNVALFDSLKGAKYAELFNSHFLLTLLTNTSGVEELNAVAFVLEWYAVYVAGGTCDVRNKSLLLTSKGVKQVTLAYVWSANK